MVRLYEVGIKNSELVIKEGIKFNSFFPIATSNLLSVSKANCYRGRTIVAKDFNGITKTLYFNENLNAYVSCNKIFVYVPFYFESTSGKIAHSGQFNADICLELLAGDTFTILTSPQKAYYLMAVKKGDDLVLKRILIVD